MSLPMGEVIALPVVRRESAELAAQDERRARLTKPNNHARERLQRRKMLEAAAKMVAEIEKLPR